LTTKRFKKIFYSALLVIISAYISGLSYGSTFDDIIDGIEWRLIGSETYSEFVDSFYVNSLKHIFKRNNTTVELSDLCRTALMNYKVKGKKLTLTKVNSVKHSVNCSLFLSHDLVRQSASLVNMVSQVISYEIENDFLQLNLPNGFYLKLWSKELKGNESEIPHTYIRRSDYSVTGKLGIHEHNISANNSEESHVLSINLGTSATSSTRTNPIGIFRSTTGDRIFLFTVKSPGLNCWGTAMSKYHQYYVEMKEPISNRDKLFMDVTVPEPCD